MRGAQTVEFLKSIHPNSKALIRQWAVHWYYLEREEQRSEQAKTTYKTSYLVDSYSPTLFRKLDVQLYYANSYMQ